MKILTEKCNDVLEYSQPLRIGENNVLREQQHLQF